MNTMSLLRNSVIVGGATFIVGSAFMEIGNADSKSDIGKWPYVATFLSGALGFYLLKQNFIPVPKALELNAEGDSWDGSTGDDFRKYDDMELTEKDHEIILEEIESGLENYPADNLRNAKASAVSQINWYGIDKAHGDYDAESFAADGDEDLDIHSGSYHGRKKSKYDGVSYISPQFDKTDQLKCKCGFRKEFHYPYSCYSCGPEAHHGKGKIVGFTTNGRIIWRDLCTGKYMVDTDGKTDIDLFNSIHQCKEAESFSAENESSSSLQSFAAEVFMADRKIRRRTRWTWTRGNEPGFEVENNDISELPYDIDYQGRQGRGYYGSYVPLYSIEDSYHISDLPEGYHLHLYKPALRSGEWRAFSKSPKSDWAEYTNYKKSNLTGDLLNWYNEDIAKPEQKTLSPIDKLMISKGMKSGTVQIERVVIPKTKYTPEKVQYFAFGGPTNMSPTKICEIENGVISLESLRYSNEPNLFAFGQGLKFMTEKAGTLRSVNRFNKNPEAWVKSYPAWFQNAVKNRLTDISVRFSSYTEHDGGIRINSIKVLKFLNGVDRFSWRPINESERKVIDTPYGEMPQFEIYELDMSDPAPITPRPSTMRKIYAQSFKQNLNGEWKFDKNMFMMAVVDKYKFENGGSEVIHNSMVDEPIYSIDIIPYMTPMAELMARRYKKKLN